MEQGIASIYRAAIQQIVGDSAYARYHRHTSQDEWIVTVRCEGGYYRDLRTEEDAQAFLDRVRVSPVIHVIGVPGSEVIHE